MIRSLSIFVLAANGVSAATMEADSARGSGDNRYPIVQLQHGPIVAQQPRIRGGGQLLKPWAR